MARPRKFNTVEEMQEAIQAYYDKQEQRGKPLTIQGLALALGFLTRQSLLDYEGYTDANDKEFLDTIKKARLYIENYKLEGLLSGELNTTGVIFDLKNNHGHKDKQVTEVVKAEELEDQELDKRLKDLERRFD